MTNVILFIPSLLLTVREIVMTKKKKKQKFTKETKRQKIKLRNGKTMENLHFIATVLAYEKQIIRAKDIVHFNETN